MSSLLILTGSPAAVSRSTHLAQAAQQRLRAAGLAAARTLHVRDLPADALLHADFDDPRIVDATQQIVHADALIVATPIYKAAYSGLLKTFLDVLPQHALQGKTVLPLATGGSPAHLLAVDYALKPVLASLGARHILSTVYAHDAQIAGSAAHGYTLDADTESRLQAGVLELLESLGRQAVAHRAAA